ncbi:MAG: hypothetical protein A2Y86_06030 [Candidatus Aminicenantes bacterium RBG_13_62_12]|nr:MAG: hypothetical protein A2Y86_06030 [Candidatus Aminicenantes bacterium RBG_13_62_12]
MAVALNDEALETVSQSGKTVREEIIALGGQPDSLATRELARTEDAANGVNVLLGAILKIDQKF